ncbi:hypothetical protein CCYA_CCYA18G4557 [Cyanidiococcus yangmingshanensis]|nr:hypothetical protein CCYA_CCYA18G4557 [Cyanidiococcus yangmingshanensis]
MDKVQHKVATRKRRSLASKLERSPASRLKLEPGEEAAPHSLMQVEQQSGSSDLRRKVAWDSLGERGAERVVACSKGGDVSGLAVIHSVEKTAERKASSRFYADTQGSSEKQLVQGGVGFLRTLDALQSQSQTHLLVSEKQRGNSLLHSIRDVPWKFAGFDFADFLLGPHSCAFFLSMKFHLLRPSYIYDRVRQLGRRTFRLRILIVLIDNEGGIFFGSGHNEDTAPSRSPLAELEKMCLLQDLTLMVAWNNDEAARILESYKMQEGRASDSLQGPLIGQRYVHTLTEGPSEVVRQGDSSLHRATAFLAASRAVNRTDAAVLLRHFGSLRKILTASVEELVAVPGIGPVKCAKLFKILHEPLAKDSF